jgi:hypothetical protein
MDDARFAALAVTCSTDAATSLTDDAISSADAAMDST